MPEEHIPTTVADFVAHYVSSIETLEILLLLFQTKERTWTAEEVQHEIRSSLSSITQNLRHLVAARLAVAGDGRQYQYRSPLPGADEQIAGLAEAYRSRRVSVIALIYRERPDPLRSFSDAFKLRPPHDR